MSDFKDLYVGARITGVGRMYYENYKVIAKEHDWAVLRFDDDSIRCTILQPEDDFILGFYLPDNDGNLIFTEHKQECTMKLEDEKDDGSGVEIDSRTFELGMDAAWDSLTSYDRVAAKKYSEMDEPVIHQLAMIGLGYVNNTLTKTLQAMVDEERGEDG